MDPFVVLAEHHAKTVQRDLGHSALPDAPVQPYRLRRRPLRRLVGAVAALARRRPATAATRRAPAAIAVRCPRRSEPA